MADRTQTVTLPDVGGGTVNVVDVLVAPGDLVQKDAGVITVEGDKAVMDIPLPASGKVITVHVKKDDTVKMDDDLLEIELSDVETDADGKEAVESFAVATDNTDTQTSQSTMESVQVEPTDKESPVVSSGENLSGQLDNVVSEYTHGVHAGPMVRRIAQEFGIDLTQIQGTGEKHRILKKDVQAFVKRKLQSGGRGFVAPIPEIDFSKFGEIETASVSKIKKSTANNLSRNWNMIPHVTQFGEADVTELETFRQNQKAHAEKKGIRLTPLVFIIKGVIRALKTFPQFNASLSNDGEAFILKKYFHIGVAVDTPNGLVVPVIRDADMKSLFELAEELATISEKARTKGLTIQDMQGGCFSISSLGGIGGMAFTPIINAPEVAILGVSRTQWKPICTEHECKIRLMLPLSLSYDHRVVDGAEAARFIVHLIECLSDIRILLL